MISDALRTRLLTDSTISTVVGTRVYPTKAPDNAATPYVVLTKVSGRSLQRTDELSGMAEALYQIDVFGPNFDTIEALTERIRLRLLGFKGIVNSTNIQAVVEWGDIQSFEPDTEFFRTIITAQVMYWEAQT